MAQVEESGIQEVEPPVAEPVTGSFVVPAFREADGIAKLLRALDGIAATSPVHWDVVIVDDGSDDGTSEAAVEAAKQVRVPVKVIRHRRNAGLGGAIRTGLSATTGDVVVAVDADLSYGVEDIQRVVDQWLLTRPQIVIASPYMEGGSSVSVPSALSFRSKAANRFLSRMALEDIKTLTGMVRAYDGPFIRSMPLKAVDADVMVEILYKAQLLRARIEEVPATLSWKGLEARASRSTLTSYRSRWVTYKQLVNGYLWRPFWFPLVPAVLAGVVFVVLAALGKVGWQGLGIIGGVLMMQLSIASLMSLQAKRYFEELYNMGYGMRRLSPTEPPRVPSVVVHTEPHARKDFLD